MGQVPAAKSGFSVTQESSLHACKTIWQDPLDESQCVQVHDDNVYIETDVPEDATRRHQQMSNHRDAVTRPGQSGLHRRTCAHAAIVSVAHINLNDLLHFQSMFSDESHWQTPAMSVNTECG